MVHELVYTILAVIGVSLISLIGILALLAGKKLNKIIFVLVAFAAGSMLGTAFFGLIPESLHEGGNVSYVLYGIILFFIIEGIIHWHHHHEDKVCENCLHPVVYLNLIGDGLHNFLDGVVIAASFLINIPAGIITSLAIVLHEIPQEIGDFGVLVHGGMKKTKALLFNFLSALVAVVGGLVGYLFLSSFERFTPLFIGLAAGSFIYIATADLFPELHKQMNFKKILIQIISLIAGVLVINLVLGMFPE